jgi:hypothetical protein
VSVPGVEEPYDQHVGRYGAQLAADAYRRLGSPYRPFQLMARAWSARGTALSRWPRSPHRTFGWPS